MGLNETMARLREQAKPKPIEQTESPKEQTESQTSDMVLKLTEIDYSVIRSSLRYLLQGIAKSRLHPKDKNKRITAINELLHKLKTQHNI